MHLACEFAFLAQQDYQLSMDKRPVVKDLIGEYAEALVYIFCTMDLASLDATLNHPSGERQAWPFAGGLSQETRPIQMVMYGVSTELRQGSKSAPEAEFDK